MILFTTTADIADLSRLNNLAASVQRDILDTDDLCRRHGARRLDLTVVDMAGVEIAPERLDDGLPEQLRLAAVAVFAGHEVTGLSDPIDREVYPGRAHTIEWQQALGQLRVQLEPPPPRHLSAVPS